MHKKLYSYSKTVVKNPLFTGSMIMVFGSNLANFFAYFYHFVLGRLLGKTAYGELVAILSLIGLLGTSYTFLNLVIVKYVSSNDFSEQKRLFTYFIKKSIYIGLPASLVVLLLTPFLAANLHLKPELIILVAPIFFIGIINFVYRSFMQGLLKFGVTALLSNIEMVGRLIFGALAVGLGFSVFGAVVGLLLSVVVSLSLSRFFLKEFKLVKTEAHFKPDAKLLKYTSRVVVSTFALTSLYTSDILLVKHFSHLDAGIYAAVATLGKTIFFASGPIASVMFPLVAQKYAKGEDYKKVFLLSMLLTLILSLGVLGLFAIIPNLAITILYGSQFLGASSYLIPYGIFILFLTLSSLVINFYLSSDKTWVVWPALTAALLQIAGIWVYNQNLNMVITVNSSVSLGLFSVLLIVFMRSRDYAKK